MAIWNLINPLNYLITTIFTIFGFLLALHKVNSESFSFSFNEFEPDLLPIALVGDATSSGGAIQLTRRDHNMNLRKHSVGRAVYLTPIHLWDINSDEVADFATEFTFAVIFDGLDRHGDGFAFFIAPFDKAFNIPANSSGGYLGLFGPDTALDPTKNRVVAVEVDSFGNEWDPVPQSLSAHVGIDVNSVESVVTAWPLNLQVPEGTVGKARVRYESKPKKMSVEISYGDKNRMISFSKEVDLKAVLPQWVRIGFSAATGDFVETHEILSWSFTSYVS